MPPPYRYWVAAVTALGAAFRFRSLFANRFHADEALFASWARQIAVWRDPLLLLQPVDKPPLLFYMQALFYPLFGPVEWAARMPNIIASLLLVPVIGVLAWRLYGDGLTAVVAAALLALSPLAIQFSATAFTDPLLTFWLMVALAAAVRPPSGASRRCFPGLCGVAFGLAAATKYQAWLFLPLLVAFALLAGWSRRDWLRALLGAAVVGLVVGVWLVARSGTGSLWALQIANAGGLRPSWSWELWPRFLTWVGLWRVSLGWPLLLAFGAAGALLLVRWLQTRRTGTPLASADVVIAIFLLGYSSLNWLFAVPVWDRYLLPVLPLVILLIARVTVAAVRWMVALLTGKAANSTPVGAVIMMGLLVMLVIPATAARLGRYPIGGQPTADQGAWLVADHLRNSPYGTVLYDHWYSWQWRYHLFDSGVYVSWFPHGDALVEDLSVFGEDGAPRFVVLPDSPQAEPVRRMLAGAGYELVAETIHVPAGSESHMALFRVRKLNP